jgi:ArsR family transcriptional regulator, zinc-responsive transcriptional repressor
MVTAKKKTSTKERDEQESRKIQRAAILLKQASDTTRVRVILMLSRGEMNVGAICAELSQTQPAVSHHLALLRHGGIVSIQRRGQNIFYTLAEMGEVLATILTTIVA